MNMAKEVDVRRNEPQENMPDMMPDFERMVENFFGDRFNSVLSDWPVITPRMNTDIRETDRAYVMTAELPGFSQDEIDVSVSGNLLNIVAEHQEKEGGEGRMRREQRSFRQSFTLPTSVDPDKIEANCENGLLEVYIPKMESAQSKKVQVQSGRGGFLNRLLGKDEKSGREVKGSQKH